MSAGHEWGDWLSRLSESGTSGIFELSAISPSICAALKKRNVEPISTAISISKGRAGHLRRTSKYRRSAGLSDEDIDRLPKILAKPEAVLLDTKGKGNSLLYVFTPIHGSTDRHKGKIVVRVDYKIKTKSPGKKSEKVVSNSVRTAGYVAAHNLVDSRYILLEGKLEDIG